MVVMNRRMDYMLVTVWVELLEKLNLYFLTVSMPYACVTCCYHTHTVVLEPLLDTTEASEYLQKNVNPILLRGLTQLCKEKPVDPLVRATVH